MSNMGKCDRGKGLINGLIAGQNALEQGTQSVTAGAGQSPGGWRGQLLAAWTAVLATNAAGSDESLRLRETDAFKAVSTTQSFNTTYLLKN